MRWLIVIGLLLASCGQGKPQATKEKQAAPAAPAAKPGPSDLRELDRRLLPMLRAPVDEPMKDVFPDMPYKVDLYHDVDAMARVRIDLDRDGKLDEVWIVDAPDRILRMVSSADDDNTFDVVLHLDNGVWAAGPPPPG